jgi:hypothetical protein
MTTTLDMINETKRYLLSTHREQYNSLNGAINSSTTSVTFNQNLGSLGGGAIISVDLELMYVWEADASSKIATVQRGFQGSTAATHSDDAMVTINPKFPDFSVFQAINHELADISGDIFQVKTETFTFIAGKEGYDLSGAVGYDVIAFLNAFYDYPGIRRNWPRLNGVYIRRDANTTDFPSGYAIIMIETAFPGREVRVSYSANLSPLATLTDDVEAVSGLRSDAHDIPALGAAIRLQGVREAQRNFNDAQPDTRRATEVPTGAQIASIRGLQDFRARRLMSTQKMLIKQYPYMRRLDNVSHSWSTR